MVIKKLKSNKKGATIDNIWMAITFFGLAIFFLTLMVVWNVLDTQVDGLWEESETGLKIQKNANNAVNNFDWIVVMVWVGFHLGILVTAFLLRTHPLMYIIAIFLTVILVVLAAPLSNAYNDIEQNEDLTIAANQLPMTSFILEQYPKLEAVWAFVTAIVMFGLARSEGFI